MMRLTAHEVDAIKTAAREAFGESAVVRLFGSRVDDRLKGGDIDLHVEVPRIDSERTAKYRFEEILFGQIDEQRVDVLISVADKPRSPIERIAYRDGVVL